MTLWLTGASGLLGRAVVESLETSGVSWVGSDLDVDIAERAAVEAFVASKRPSAVINCAAYTAVDAAETDEDNAQRVNGTAPGILAEVCLARGMRLIHVSTDYVFDGECLEEYDEQAPVAPCNAYGRTKLAGERNVLRVFKEAPPPSASQPWYVVRTSWLFGSGRSSFVETMWRLMLERPIVRVVDDQFGRPTYAADLAKALVRLATETTGTLESGIWHYANTGKTSWFGFAMEIRAQLLRLGQPVLAEDLLAVTSAEFPRPARRPRSSVLSTRRLEASGFVLRDWRSGLREYLELRIR